MATEATQPSDREAARAPAMPGHQVVHTQPDNAQPDNAQPDTDKLIAALRAAANRATRILESAIDYAIVVLDLDGLVTSWNEGARRIMGWTEAEMLGRPASVFFTPEDRQLGIPQAEMQAALGEGRGSDERWHLNKAGSRFWGNGEMMTLRDEEGIPQGFIKILRDRTEQRNAAERQRADAEFLRGILASSQDCIKVLDLDGKLVFMSEGGRHVMEVSDFNGIRGCPWIDFWQGQGNREAKAALAVAMTGGTGRFQGPANTFAGNPRWWDVQVTPILDANGKPEKLLCVSRDITGTKLGEARLIENEARLRELNETLEGRVEQRTRERDRIWRVSREMLGVTDSAGVWVSVNPAWTRILGWTAEEITGRTSGWMEHPEDHPKSQAEVSRLATGHTTVAFENRLLTRLGGYRTLSWTVVALEGLFYFAGRDVTELQEKQAVLADTEERLRQSQKMEAVGQLTGGLAHDFNNLLTGISGSLELLGKRIEQGRTGDLDRYIAAAKGAADRAAALTHRLLAFSRRQTLDPKPTDGNRLVKSMDDLIRRTVGPAIEVATGFEPALWSALCDPNQLENALLNLCINGRDAMPDGGHLTIRTSNVDVDKGFADLRDMQPGRYVALSVTDSGTGMAPDVAARAFDPFFTTKPLGLGTGLGLSMVYGFARQSGGQVRIHSVEGAGTTVTIFLPRYLGEELAEPDGGTLASAPHANVGETVLVVDDEPTVRMLVADVLQDLGYAAIEAADGASGLRVLQSDTRVDLLVTDVGLPGGMNGRQMADAARIRRPRLKVLFITGYAAGSVVGKAALDPGMQVMTKPFGMDVLATRISAMIKQR